MKAIRLYGTKGQPRLAFEDAPEPAPGPDEIAIRVRAAAVTPTELEWMPTWTARSGEPRALPVIPGHELCGVVEAVGAGVEDLRAGDAVYGMNDWFRDGAQAEVCIARAPDVAPKPGSIDHVAASSVPISALTAWQGLVVRARLAAGERVLIHGGAGAVGAYAVQIARGLGAHVIATASAPNLDFVRSLGADRAVDRRAERFEDAGAVDVVFDTVGGETLARSWAMLRPGGRLVTIASSEEATAVQRDRDAFFIVEPDRAQLAEIARRIDAGEMRPVVGAVFPLAEGARAYAHKPGRGKTVLAIASAE